MTAEQFDRLAEGGQDEKAISDFERSVLTALAHSNRMRRIQLKRIEWMLEGIPQEAQDACIMLEMFSLGKRYAEGEALDAMFALEAHD